MAGQLSLPQRTNGAVGKRQTPRLHLLSYPGIVKRWISSDLDTLYLPLLLQADQLTVFGSWLEPHRLDANFLMHAPRSTP
jgi:hypothetical protein